MVAILDIENPVAIKFNGNYYGEMFALRRGGKRLIFGTLKNDKTIH